MTTALNTTNREPVTVRTQIRFLKDEIPIEDYASKVTKLSGRGVERRGCCPIHQGENPTSFSVHIVKQVFYCHACQARGDLIDLCVLVEKHADTWTAVISLAEQYDLELPQRSETWHQFSTEKYTVRDAVQKHLADVYQRRLTRVYAPLVLVGGETPDEELEALDELAAALWPVCYEMAGRRVHG
jgi:DNA primase